MKEQPHDPIPRGREHRQHDDQGKLTRSYTLGIVVTQRELVQFLVRSASDYSMTPCEVYPCEVCDGFRALWHDLYHELTATYRLTVEEALEALDIRSPQARTGGL